MSAAQVCFAHVESEHAAHIVVPEDRGVVDHNGHQQYEDDRNEAVASNDATIKHLLTLTPRSGSLFHNAKPKH
jgi:hypothetical protein